MLKKDPHIMTNVCDLATGNYVTYVNSKLN